MCNLDVRFSNESDLKRTLDFLYDKSKQGISLTGLLEAVTNEVTIVTAIHNIKSNGGSQTVGVDGKAITDIFKCRKKSCLI